MLRIFFSRDDVARTRVAPAPDPMWELVLSLHLLQGRLGKPYFGNWRRTVGQALTGTPLASRMRTLLAMCPPRGYFPDFLTPPDGLDGLPAGLDALRHTPAAVLERDLNRLSAQAPAPDGAADLARGRSGALIELTTTMSDYYGVAVEPYWPRVLAATDADRARRGRAVLDGGAEGLLASLRPMMRWQDSHLDVDYPVNQEMHLNNRGLLLVPSYFCWGSPVTLLDEDMPPVLIYPIERLPVPPRDDGAPDLVALAALLGSTRAAILAAVATGGTTTELARRVGVSPAAVSQHTSVLRAAGLLYSQRDRNSVLHTMTPLGFAVLRGG